MNVFHRYWWNRHLEAAFVKKHWLSLWPTRWLNPGSRQPLPSSWASLPYFDSDSPLDSAEAQELLCPIYLTQLILIQG